uniref:Uncharacterized protein n=1 Tax=Melopsittacus undulatus TaxID=13146 RepID=A0A8V5GI68_MELUD
MGSWVWRPHCPRGPITALYISPGPKYGLPSSISECRWDGHPPPHIPHSLGWAGPSTYHLPPMLGPHLVSKTSAPATPCPGRYHTVDTDVYKHRAPRFSMVVRNMPPGDTTTKPGPAAYSPRQVSRDPRGQPWGSQTRTPPHRVPLCRAGPRE